MTGILVNEQVWVCEKDYGSCIGVKWSSTCHLLGPFLAVYNQPGPTRRPANHGVVLTIPPLVQAR